MSEPYNDWACQLVNLAKLCDKNFKAVGDYQLESNKQMLAMTMALLTILIDKGLATSPEFDVLVNVCRQSIDASFGEEARRQQLSDLMERLTRPSKQ